MRLRVPLLPRAVRWLAVCGLAAFIFYVSILTVPPETVVDKGKPALLPLDKWRHFVAYAMLGYSLAYAASTWDADRLRVGAFVVCAVVLYGVGIEVGQSMIPQRYFSVGDAYANALGALLVVPYFLLEPSLEFVDLGTLLDEVRGSP